MTRLTRLSRLRKQRKAINKEIVQVSINDKKYQVKYSSSQKGNVLMITNHPKDKKKVLVWRNKGDDHYVASEAKLKKTGIIEDIPTIGIMDTLKFPMRIDVSHFHIVQRLRGKGIGTVFREIIIQKARELAKEQKVDESEIKVDFPTVREHHKEFYEPRGFKRAVYSKAFSDIKVFRSTVDNLNYSKTKRKLNWVKGLENKGFKIYWAKQRLYEKK